MTILSWLVASDGSEHSLRAIAQVIDEASRYTVKPEILLLNVQPPLPSDVARFVASDIIEDYHREAGEAALASAREQLTAAGISCSHHILVGEIARSIVEFARAHQCTRIVIGARGVGSISSLLLGSVTSRVIQLSLLPILVVK